MAEIPKRETRNRGERRPVVPAELTPRATISTPVKPTKSLKRKSPEPSAIVVAAAAPVNRDTSSLPSSTTKPHADLPDAEFESVAESGILAASLKQSLDRWRDGGCFEKYHVKKLTKVYKDAGWVNPSLQTMNKLGDAELTIEPHRFRVTLFSARPLPPKPVQQTLQPVVAQIPPYKTPTRLIPAFPSLSGEDAGKTSIPIASANPNPVGLVETPIRGKPVSTSQTPTPSRPSTSSTQSAADTANTNPVIKELAKRAAANPELKELMKEVASNTADQQKLKRFQFEIDDINAMLRRLAPKPVKVEQKKDMPVIAPRPTVAGIPLTQSSTPVTKQEFRPPSHQGTSSAFKAPPTITLDGPAVVFEIANGTGDKYLLPRRSLLEFHDGDRIAVLSFLVHLKGEVANRGAYQNNQEYCELVTIKLRADRAAILEPLRRAVDSPDIVRKHMEDWVKQMKIAEKAFLVLRKTRQTAEETRPYTAIPMVIEDGSATQFGAPSFLFSLKRSKVA